VSESVAARIAVPAAETRRRWRFHGIWICFAFVGLVVVLAAVGSIIAPYNPSAQDVTNEFAKPSSAHLLGTDALGRDVLSRVMAGARSALVGPLVIAGASMILGNLLGLLAGYRGGWVDAVIMRWVDLMWSIPGLIVIIVVEGALGGGYWLAVLLLVVLSVPFDTRIVRAATLEQTPRPYVEAAKVLGVSNLRIMVMHIWPNVSPVAVANSFLNFAGALVAIAGVSFLGLGVPIGSSDWGLMLSQGESLLVVNPVAVLAPGVMIVALATSMNLIGDWLYERLSGIGATR
jgi:peptide/nickel transport system permease protein